MHSPAAKITWHRNTEHPHATNLGQGAIYTEGGESIETKKSGNIAAYVISRFLIDVEGSQYLKNIDVFTEYLKNL